MLLCAALESGGDIAGIAAFRLTAELKPTVMKKVSISSAQAKRASAAGGNAAAEGIKTGQAKRRKHLDEVLERRMFTLLRLSLWGGEEDLSIFEGATPQEWMQLYRLSVAQSVVAIAFDGVMRLPEALRPGADIRIRWGFSVGKIEEKYMRKVVSARKMTELFAANGIRTMIMKGLSVSGYYPQPSHRHFSDIDIYLFGDYERGNSLIKQKGNRVTREFFVHSEFRVGGVDVENHEVFVNDRVNRTGAYIQGELKSIADRGLRPMAGIEGAYSPSAEFTAIFMTRHTSWHYARECITLRDLCDWTVFLNSEADGMNTGYVIPVLERSGLDRYASIITEICRRHLGLEKGLPFKTHCPELAERVKDDILTFERDEKTGDEKPGVARLFWRKARCRISRKWCYDMVVPDNFYGNILYSLKGYISDPKSILRAKA